MIEIIFLGERLVVNTLGFHLIYVTRNIQALAQQKAESHYCGFKEGSVCGHVLCKPNNARAEYNRKGQPAGKHQGAIHRTDSLASWSQAMFFP